MTSKESLREKWHKEANKKHWGACFECCDFERIVDETFDFFWNEIQKREEELIQKIEKLKLPLKCFDENCPFCLRGLSRKCSQIQSIEEKNDIIDNTLTLIKSNE